MTSPVPRRLAPVCVLALCLSAPALGADMALPSIVVSGARPGEDAAAPIGAVVISGEAIRRSGAGGLMAALRKLGVAVPRRHRAGKPGPRAGGAASLHEATLLDGASLAEQDPDDALLATLPLERIERVEISGGAGAAVINVVTRPPSATAAHGGVSAEAGQYGRREGRAAIAQAWDGFALDAAANGERSDNVRADSRFRRSGFSAAADWSGKDGGAGVNVESARQSARFQAPWHAWLDRRAARPDVEEEDLGALDSCRVGAFADRRIGNLKLSLDLTRREKTITTTYVRDYGRSVATYASGQTQLAPRLRHRAKGAGLANELVLGVDLARWRHASATDGGRVDTLQRSRALYLRDELKFDAHAARIAVGARRELFRREAHNPDYPDTVERSVQGHNAWDVEASIKPLPALTLHAKAGQSYRVDDKGYTSASLTPLAGEVAHDLELGAALEREAGSVGLRLFRRRLNNEIVFDQSLGQMGANRNLDPTQRHGVELDASARLGAEWQLSGRAQYLRARFSSAPRDDIDIALLPRHSVSARLSWLASAGHSADIGVQWSQLQRYGADAGRRCPAVLPSFTTFDARYARTLGPWELALGASNLADRRHSGLALSCQLALYQDERRQITLTARYSF
ncbi:TonB-dependent receptor [Janthinobacterium fluminis]|uniref:TonB-dependent receptor n=1 Tax=Janthinobacterium fluminis TaxID=2987524 RepID=A0ABT5JXT9_9BURK|nr:TonB-dependent receptor [Janthinobacterium fluminis]MDC8757552.1 TonB-dependent receptor [Janthinobacterium fluminis]